VEGVLDRGISCGGDVGVRIGVLVSCDLDNFHRNSSLS